MLLMLDGAGAVCLEGDGEVGVAAVYTGRKTKEKKGWVAVCREPSDKSLLLLFCYLLLLLLCACCEGCTCKRRRGRKMMEREKERKEEEKKDWLLYAVCCCCMLYAEIQLASHPSSSSLAEKSSHTTPFLSTKLYRTSNQNRHHHQYQHQHQHQHQH